MPRAAMVFTVLAGCHFGATNAATDAIEPIDVRDARRDLPIDGAMVGPWGTPILIAELSTTANDDDPSLTGDMLEIYFGSTRGGGMGSEDIWSATRTSATVPFGAPVAVTPLNSPMLDSNVDVTADGLTLVFTSNRAGSAVYDLYMSTRVSRSAPWGTPARALDLSSTADEWGAYLTSDRLHVVLCSTRAGNNEALFGSVRAATAQDFPTPTELPGLETNANECDAMQPDPQTIYFTSDRPQGAGGLDIYRARWTGASFEDVTNVTELNTGDRDSDPWVSADQRTIVFSSNRANGLGLDDLYISTR